MKNRYSLFFISVFFALIFGGACYYKLYKASPKIEAQAVRIAVIYAKRIKKESKPYQQFENYFEKEREKIHQDILEKEKSLRLEFSDIKKEKKNNKNIEQKKENLQEKLNVLNNNLQVQKDEFLQRIQKIESTLQKELQKSIDKIIKKYGFNLVLNAELDEKTMVFYCDPRFDITNEIINDLNKVVLNP
ncbi:MAG: hypothetical protein HEEMFOPI_00036 [Holosporales bacterium]